MTVYDFTVKDGAGGAVSLSGYAGKVAGLFSPGYAPDKLESAIEALLQAAPEQG